MFVTFLRHTLQGYPCHGDWAPHPGPESGARIFEHQATTLNLNLNHACYISEA